MMTRYRIILSGAVFFLLNITFVIGQEERSLKQGIVWDSQKNPIKGALIRSTVTGLSKQTDDKGSFQILATENDTLIINHLGYVEKMITSFDSYEMLNIILTVRENIIEEVEVSTGYQILKSNEITGSIQVIDKKMLNEQMGINVLDRLRNVSSGLLFDNIDIGNKDLQKHNFTVRGLSTINGAIDPLIVLDGFIYEGNIDNIDPNSVESISILKDAAATSIWGARAGNGVIVINSKKKGKQEGTQVSFQQSLLIGQKSDYSNLYEMGISEFIAIEEMLFHNGYYDNQLSRNPERAITPVINILDKRRKGLITQEDSLTMVNTLKNNSSKKAYRDYFLQKPSLKQSFLGISHTTGNMRSDFGLGFTNDEGESLEKMRKLNLNFKNHLQLSSKLHVGLNLQFTNQNSNSGVPSFQSFSHGGKSVPYTAFVDKDNVPLPFDLAFNTEFMSNYHTEYLLPWEYVPIDDFKKSVSKSDLTEWYAVSDIRYQPFEFLNLYSGFQIQSQNLNDYADHDYNSYYTRTLINQFTEIDEAQNLVKYNVPRGGIRKEDKSVISSYTWRNQIDLVNKWGVFDVKSILGSEIRESKANGSSMQIYGYNKNPLRTVAVDYSKPYPTLPTGGNLSILGSPTYSQTLNRFISIYLNTSVLYDGKYAFYGSLRRDGANIFGAKTNDQWTPFWSIGGSWEISKENFYLSELFPFLKFRATYGYSGNVDLRKTPLPIASSFTASLTNFPTLVINTMNDPTLRWEKVRTYNIALDFTFKNNIVNGTVEYYEKQGSDLYGPTPYDYTAYGRSGTITKNVAKMVGRGIESRISISPIQRSNISLKSEAIINFNKNKTIDYYKQDYTGINSFIGSGSRIVPIEGKPLHAIAVWKWAGLDVEGNPQGFLEGVPSIDYSNISWEAAQLDEAATNLYFVGSSVPQAFGSLINTIRYKAFKLSFNFSYKGDYYFMKPVTSYSTLYTMGNAQRDFEDRWINNGDELLTNVPSVNYPFNRDRDAFYAGSEINVLKGDHIRFEYINVGWNTSFRLGQRDFKTLLNLNLNNLGVVWRKNSWVKDPAYPENILPGKRIGMSLKVEL